MYLSNNGFVLSVDPTTNIAQVKNSSENVITESRVTFVEPAKCHDGFYSTVRFNHSSCVICPKGNSCIDDAKTLCPPGTYQDEEGSTGCKPSPPGYYTSDAGSLSPTQCPVGQYQNESGKTSCKTPLSGYCFEDQTKEPIVLNQIQGKFPGSYCDETTNKITQCPIGYKCYDGKKFLCGLGEYQDQPGQSDCKVAENGFCLNNTTKQLIGIGQIQPGKYCRKIDGGITSVEDCPIGFKCTGQGQIIPCNDRDQYQDSIGQSTCKTVSDGFCKVDNTSQILISWIPSGKYCLTNGGKSGEVKECPLGTYQPMHGNTSCLPASPGYYVGTTGSSAQKRCPVNTGSDGSTSSCSACSDGKPHGCSTSIMCSRSDVCSTKCCEVDSLVSIVSKWLILGWFSELKGLCVEKVDNSICKYP